MFDALESRGTSKKTIFLEKKNHLAPYMLEMAR